MLSTPDRIYKQMKQLMPKSRAFKVPQGGFLDRLLRALGRAFGTLVEDIRSTFYSRYPDNDGFTADDATIWERRLGILASPTTSLAVRKAAIARKLGQPGRVKARQSYLYLQKQLQDAGFDVYVYENRFDNSGTLITKPPAAVVGSSALVAMVGNVQCGQVQCGQGTTSGIEKIANKIDPADDASFQEGSNFRSTFFIAGSTISTYADVPLTRRDEFRQLILNIKPAQTLGYLLVNYI